MVDQIEFFSLVNSNSIKILLIKSRKVLFFFKLILDVDKKNEYFVNKLKLCE